MSSGRSTPYVMICPITGKRGFATKSVAKTAKRSMGGQGLSVFFCLGHGSCGYWHVGHNGGKPRVFHREWHEAHNATRVGR